MFFNKLYRGIIQQQELLKCEGARIVGSVVVMTR